MLGDILELRELLLGTRCSNGGPRGPQSKKDPKGDPFLVRSVFIWGPWKPHLSTESLKVTLGAPKCLPKWSKIIEKITSTSSKNKQKKYRVWIPACSEK